MPFNLYLVLISFVRYSTILFNQILCLGGEDCKRIVPMVDVVFDLYPKILINIYIYIYTMFFDKCE